MDYLTQIVDACTYVAEQKGECTHSDAQHAPFCYTYRDEKLHIAYTVDFETTQVGILFENKPLDHLMLPDLIRLINHVYPLYAKQLLNPQTD